MNADMHSQFSKGSGSISQRAAMFGSQMSATQNAAVVLNTVGGSKYDFDKLRNLKSVLESRKSSNTTKTGSSRQEKTSQRRASGGLSNQQQNAPTHSIPNFAN